MAKHAKKRQNVFKNRVFKNAVKITVIVIFSASLLLNLFNLITPVVKYYGNSMSPTLNDGQILVVSKISKIKNGDIIAFYYNNKVIVRRVVATPNSQLSIDAFGTVSVNGKDIDEPYVEDKTLGQCNVSFPMNIPADSYFVLGDNRKTSMDSRLEEIGVVNKDRILGKVIIH